ncbi:T9SS type A sorting domain-containing protein [Pedobacter sp.]
MKKTLLSFLFTLITAVGFAQWSINPKVNTAVVGSGNSQRSNASIDDGAGGVIVVFEENVWDAINSVGYTQIFAQRLSAAGVALWSSPTLIATAPDYTEKQIIADGSGGVVVFWSQKTTNGANQPNQLYAQRLNSSGTKLWATNGLALTTTASGYWISAVIMDSNNLIYAYSNYDGVKTDSYIQKIDLSGAKQWGADLKLNDAAGEYESGLIFKDGVGYTVVFGEEYEINANDEGNRFYWQKLNANGTKNGGNVLLEDLLPVAGIEYYGAQVIADGNGGLYYTIVATNQNDDSKVKLYLQHIAGNGAKQFNTTNWGLEIDATAGALVGEGASSYWNAPISMVLDGSGGVVLGWGDTRNGKAGLYAQRYNSSGTKLWNVSDIELIRGPINGFYGSNIKVDASNNFSFVLQKNFGAGNGPIYLQKISAAGALVYATQGILISSRTADKYDIEQLVFSDKIVAVWNSYDEPTAKYNVFVQSVFNNGELAQVNFNGFSVINTRTLEGFNTIQAAIDDADTKNGDELRIAAGVFTERLNVTKELGIYGNNAGIEPWLWTKQATIIKTPSTDFVTNVSLVLLGANNVAVDGIQFEGTNDALSDAAPRNINGKANRIPRAISTVINTAFGNLLVSNNKFTDFTDRAISLFSVGSVQTGLVITNNMMDNISAINVTSSAGNALGILTSNYIGEISNNKITRANTGIQSQFQSFGMVGSLNILKNNITLYKSGIVVTGSVSSDTPPINVNDNFITAANAATWTADGLNTANIFPRGIWLLTLPGDSKIMTARDTVSNMRWAFEAYRIEKSTVDLNRFVVQGGLYQSNYIGFDSYNDGNLTYDTRVVLDGVKMVNNELLGLLNESSGAFKSEMVLRNGVQVLHNAPTATYENAISIFGTNAQLNELNDTKISGANKNFISFRSTSGNAPMNGLTVDGKDVTYDGTVDGQTFNNYKPSATMDLTLRNAVKARIFDGDIATNVTAGKVLIPGGTLPVSLIDFNATLKSSGVLVTWSTAVELNNKHFLVEKSTDGISFSTIATVNGKGNTQEKSSYQFTDVNFFQSAYYRLTQEDLNGTKIVYQDLIKYVKTLGEAEKVAVYPNPTAASVFVKSNEAKNGLTAKLMDLTGRVLESKTTTGRQLEFNLTQLPKGTYLVQSKDDKGTFTEKVIKQ